MGYLGPSGLHRIPFLMWQLRCRNLTDLDLAPKTAIRTGTGYEVRTTILPDDSPCHCYCFRGRGGGKVTAKASPEFKVVGIDFNSGPDAEERLHRLFTILLTLKFTL